MTERSIVHGTFTVERSFTHAPAKVFAAWAKPEQKRQWFGAPDDTNPTHAFDFRVGGREYSEGKMGDSTYTFEVRYQDIIPDTRIVYTYDMTMNGERISVSLATLQITPNGNGGSKVVLREDGAFLDGLDDYKLREEGTNYLMDQLGAFLDK